MKAPARFTRFIPTFALLFAVLARPAPGPVAATGEPSARPRIRIDGNRLVAESDRFTATFEGASLVSAVARGAGAEFCRRYDAVFPLELVYAFSVLKEWKTARKTA